MQPSSFTLQRSKEHITEWPQCAPQLWILLTVCTLSALPWMVIEFKRNNYSVHYQGEAPLVASRPASPALAPCSGALL